MDYTENPHSWLRSLKSWLSILRDLYYEDNHQQMMESFKLKHKNFEEYGKSIQPIGVNTLIAVVNTETRPDWEHSIFEYIQFVLRTISLKHGFSLIYSSLLRSDQRIIQMISSIMDMETTHKAQSKLESNLVDHTEILVPGGIDSWGKIKTLNDDIEPSQVSQEWSLDSENKLIEYYERIVPDQAPKCIVEGDKEPIVIKDISYQEFLTKQYEKHTSQEKILKEFIHNVQSRAEDT